MNGVSIELQIVAKEVLEDILQLLKDAKNRGVTLDQVIKAFEERLHEKKR